MKTSELRSVFLDYFRSRGHERVPSSSLVPGNDPTLLFTNSGMVQFKDVFLGAEKRNYNRAVTAQRCVRAGGKHNDLENVGYTARHHTFFEMLGNFSFGDYFKREAIHFAWNLLTDEIGLSPDKLWVTVYSEDDEAAQVWLDEIGVPAERFARIATSDNFWSMGETGPCGPCSEIFYDHGPNVEGGPPGSENEDGDRYIELWNLVFMQFERFENGEMKPLPRPSVDTGMGLERIAAVMQQVHSNYEIDLFQSLIADAAKVVGTRDIDSKSLRVIADHIRSAAFLIVDGVTPSNENRGYVLRRIIRRAIRHGYQLGCKTPFFHQLTGSLTDQMGDAYPELRHARSKVESVLQREGDRFSETLDQGIRILNREIASLTGSVLPGEVAFRLYDTYGFPLDLTADYLRDFALTVDYEGFEASMSEQRARGKTASRFDAVASDEPILDVEVKFVGYGELTAETELSALIVDGAVADSVTFGREAVLILRETPFYAEGGGQVGDNGTICCGDEGEFQVTDTRYLANQVVGHFGQVTKGEFAKGRRVTAAVDLRARESTKKNHSATHLLHAALKNNLGSHVQQKGSLVAPDRLRFDFSHHEAVGPSQIEAVEAEVNRVIQSNHDVVSRIMDLTEAKANGAEALFGEKYDSKVRVIEMGDYSMELCGGTHVERTGDIGFFRIVHESSIASGIRRVEALSGEAAVRRVQDDAQILRDVASSIHSSAYELKDSVAQLLERNRALEREVSDLKMKLATGTDSDRNEQIQSVDGISVLTLRYDGIAVKELRKIMDQARRRIGSGVVVIGSATEGKATLLCAVSDDLLDRVNAGDLIRRLSPVVGGSGGGKAHTAQGGGANIEMLDDALKSVAATIA